MIKEKYYIWDNNEYQHPGTYGFIPFIMSYQHNDDQKRPAILIIPGGGYAKVSDNEGESVARNFYDKGYQVFVCVYTTNLLEEHIVGKQALLDVSRAIRFLRHNSVQLRIQSNKIATCAFSAGGHLAACLNVHYPEIEDTGVYAAHSNRPDASILSYPVISSTQYAHKESFIRLIGQNPSWEEQIYYNPHLHVHADTPPSFLWHTVDDQSVSYMNSVLYLQSCLKHQINVSFHLFPKGSHGLSIGKDFDIKDDYTLEQIKILYQNISDKKIKEKIHKQIFFKKNSNDLKKSMQLDEINQWPSLADAWLKSL